MTTATVDAGQARAEIIDLATRRGATAAGIADVDGFPDQPGMHPTDVLPNAKSVVVLGGSAPRAAEWISPNPELMETIGTADRITVVGNAIAHHIESRYGYYAVSTPPGTDKGDRPFLDFKTAAELAGLGTRSLAGPILHPDQGMLYLSAIVTTLELPYDGPLADPVCPAPQCVDMWDSEGTTPCLSVCPIDAGGCLGGELIDGRIASRRYDKDRCTTRVYNYWVPGYQQALEAALNEDDQEKRKMILFGSFFTRTMWSITYSNVSQGQCAECMRVCPVGKQELL